MSKGGTPDKPVHRLLDIEVEEVSLVDRAANRRRFLVVKRSEGMGGQAGGEQSGSGTQSDTQSDESAVFGDIPTDLAAEVEAEGEGNGSGQAGGDGGNGGDSAEADGNGGEEPAGNEGGPGAIGDQTLTPGQALVPPSGALAIALSALESLTDVVEQLGGTDGADHPDVVGSLVHELQVTAEQLAQTVGGNVGSQNAGGVGVGGHGGVGGQSASDASGASAGNPNDGPSVLASIRETLSQVQGLVQGARQGDGNGNGAGTQANSTGGNGGAGNDTGSSPGNTSGASTANSGTQGTSPSNPNTNGRGTSASSAPCPLTQKRQTGTAGQPGGNDGDAQLRALAALNTSLRGLTDTVRTQASRLTQLEKRFGLPNSTPPEGRSTAPRDEDSWPLDLNRPMDRDSVDKATSFLDL